MNVTYQKSSNNWSTQKMTNCVSSLIPSHKIKTTDMSYSSRAIGPNNPNLDIDRDISDDVYDDDGDDSE